MPEVQATCVAIDDQAEILGLYRAFLRSSGISIVGTALDGAQGEEVVKEMSPDFVILDLAMPGQDGLQTLVNLREAHPDLPVIVVSGFPAEATERRVLELGAVGLIAKGLPPDEFRRRVVELHQKRPVPLGSLRIDREAAFRRRVSESI